MHIILHTPKLVKSEDVKIPHTFVYGISRLPLLDSNQRAGGRTVHLNKIGAYRELLRCPVCALPTARLRCTPSVWGARYLPCRRSGCVSYRPRHTLMLCCICHRQRKATRPRPLARVAPPATGGAPLAPYLLRYAHSVKGGLVIVSSLMQMHQGTKKSRYPNGYLLFLAPLVGLEPTTCGLTVRRSTD